MIVVLTQRDIDRRLLDKRGMIEVEQHADAIVALSDDGGKFQVKKIRALDMGAAKDAWFDMSWLTSLVQCTQNGYRGTFVMAVAFEEERIRRIKGDDEDEAED